MVHTITSFHIVAVSGSDLFAVNQGNNSVGSIGEYTTSGDTVNPALITGLSFPRRVAVVPVPDPGSLTLTLLRTRSCGTGIPPVA